MLMMFGWSYNCYSAEHVHTYALLEDNDLVLDHGHDLRVTRESICLDSLDHLCHPSFLVGR